MIIKLRENNGQKPKPALHPHSPAEDPFSRSLHPPKHDFTKMKFNIYSWNSKNLCTLASYNVHKPLSQISSCDQYFY